MEETKKIYLWENKITILENNINNYENTPLAVKNILNNPRLKGIHNTIGKLIDCPDKYVIALDIAMGGASNYLVVDDEARAIEAIDYLKSQKLGRATFYPLNIIKPRYIAKDVIDSIRNINGFIGILSDLVEYDYKYKNIIDRELGQVILVDIQYLLIHSTCQLQRLHHEKFCILIFFQLCVHKYDQNLEVF